MNNSESTKNDGFTIEELQMYRAKLLVKKELAKTQLLNKFNGNVPQQHARKGLFSSVISNFTQTISLIDFALIGFKIAHKLVQLKKS